MYPIVSDLHTTMNASKSDIAEKVAESLSLLRDDMENVYLPDGYCVAASMVELYDMFAKLGWVRFEHCGGDNIVRHIIWQNIGSAEELKG